MKHKLLFLFFLFCSIIAIAQEKNQIKKEPTYKKMMGDWSINFYTVCDSAEAYFKTIDRYKKGSGYKPYMRWRFREEGKYYPSGNRMTTNEFAPLASYKTLNSTENTKNINKNAQPWVTLGPDNSVYNTENWASGIGRVEYVEVNKNNPQQIYFASRGAGVFRTNNEGASWTKNSDNLPASGVNCISAKPTNFEEALINVRTSESQLSFGVYRTTDGGATFSETAFNPTNLGFGGLGNKLKIYCIKYHPTIPNLVFIGTSKGIFRSTDNLTTTNWTQQVSGGDVMDIEFHPTNPNIMYIYDDYFANNKNRVLMSSDAGLSYNALPTIPANNNNELFISTSTSCADCIYVTSTTGMWKYLNLGTSVQTIQGTVPTGIVFDEGIVNDIDDSKIITGYLNLFRSIDSGATFNQCAWYDLGDSHNGTGTKAQNMATSTKYVHADLNYLTCVNGVFYTCTDGFVSKSTDNGLNWTILNRTRGGREYYRLGVSQSIKDNIALGAQDQGSSMIKDGVWWELNGSDGIEQMIHPLNNNYIIGSTQEGGRFRSINGGISTSGITPANSNGTANAAWEAPMFFDPNDHFTIYSFSKKTYKSTDYGTTWTELGQPASFTSPIGAADISQSNTKKIIVARYQYIDMSSDGGVSYASIKGNLPNISISDVAFHPNDENTIFVTYDGYDANNQKIFVTNDSGATWNNITYNLGNMPIHNIIVANDIIYIGTEIGVYKKTLSGISWEPFNTNFPAVSVLELDYSAATNTLYAATWGRGLWKTKLDGRENYPEIIKTEITDLPTFSVPKTSVPQFVTSQINYSGTLSNVYVSWASGSPTFNETNVIPMSLVFGNTWKSNTALPDFPVGTKVYFKVTAVGNSSDITETYKFMYEVRPFEFCNGSGGASTSTMIERFTCSNIDNQSSANNIYSYYNSTPMVLFKGQTYSATADFGYISTGNTDYYVWIDYNNDANFKDDERIITNTNIPTTSSPYIISGSFTVPTNLANEDVRMRVRAGYWSTSIDPCESTLGEVEDYLVKIVDKPNITFSGDNSYCLGQPIALNYTGSTVDAIAWEISDGTTKYNYTGNNVNIASLPIGNYSVTVKYTLYGIVFSEVFNNNFKVTPTPSAISVITPDETITANTIKQITATGGNTTGNKHGISSGDVNKSIPDNDLVNGIAQTFSVSNIPTNATVTQVDVLLNVTHPWLKDLRINLEAPNGKIVNLFNQHGDSGDNLINTIITSNTTAPAFTNVATAAPFTGTFKASLANQTTIATTPAINSTLFSDLFNNPNGDWKVRIYDDGSGDLGTLVNCSITITYNNQQITWSPITNLFTDATCNTPYVEGLNLTTVYAKPTATITYTATTSPSYCNTSDSVTFTVSGTLGTDNNEIDKVIIYPNPIEHGEILTIKNLKGKYTFQLLDATSRVIMNKENEDNNVKIPFIINPGVYFINILNDGKKYKYKLIVK